MPYVSDETSVAKTNYTKPFLALTTIGTLTIGSFLGSIDWRLDALSHFRPHFFVLCLALLISGVVVGDKLLAILFLCLSLMHGIAIWNNLLPVRTSPAFTSNTSISVSAINVLWDNQKFDDVVRVVNENGTDIVVFSEVADNTRAIYKERLQETYPYSADSDASGRGDVLVLSKLPILDSKPFVTKGNHSGVRVTILSSIGEIALYGIHPYSPLSQNHWRFRNIFMMDLADAVKKETLPVIIAGDMNNTFWSPHFKNFLDRTDLQPAFGLQGTYHAAQGKFGIDIDHILASKQMSISNKSYYSIPGSDHRGVSATVYLKQQ